MTPYRDFSELVLHATKDKDYRIEILDRGATVTVTAVHGGGIEPLTSELAIGVAGGDYNLYNLQGLRSSGNEELRVPIANFDEMRLRGLLKRSRVAVSVQGMAGSEAAVSVRGRNKRLRDLVSDALNEAGFVLGKPSSSMPSHDPSLFFNTPADGGIQIEFTRRLREEMAGGPLTGLPLGAGAARNDMFERCVAAIRSALERYHQEQRSDLDAAMRRFEETTREFVSLLRDAKRDDLN